MNYSGDLLHQTKTLQLIGQFSTPCRLLLLLIEIQILRVKSREERLYTLSIYGPE